MRAIPENTQTGKGCATLYEGIGSVKRHFQMVSREARFFFLYKESCSSLHFDQGSLRESSGGNWFHQPSIRSPHFRP